MAKTTKKTTAKKTAAKKTTTKKAATAKTAAKKTATKKTVKKAGARCATKGKCGPTYEQVAARAFEIYADRVAHGKPGTPDGDWHEAERQLNVGG